MINSDENLEKCRNEWLESYDLFLDKLSECDEEIFDICSDCVHIKLCEKYEIEPDCSDACDFYDRIA